ncbi:hypothetical protein, partial [Desulfocucumis palustris]
GAGDAKLAFASGLFLGMDMIFPFLYFMVVSRCFMGIGARVYHGIKNPRLALANLKCELKMAPPVIDVIKAPGAWTITLGVILTVNRHHILPGMF